MRKLTILIPASPNPAFLSQVATFSLALRKLKWTRWKPTLHVILGGEPDITAITRWYCHLSDVSIALTSQVQFSQSDNWSQCDDVFCWSPVDADVVATMDADTLPVKNFEDVLDRVAATDVIAGTMAHYRPPIELAQCGDGSGLWDWLSKGLIQKPLLLSHSYSLIEPSAPAEIRLGPFYLNFGVVFFSKANFEKICSLYPTLRKKVANRLPNPDFSGQIALALAIAEADVGIWELPMRMNFPNDDLAT